MSFAELGAHPSLVRALVSKGYENPTPVQAAVLGAAKDRDLLVSAQTGSGKTVAFGLALAPTLLGDAELFPRAREPLALVIAPTRELALQVQRELTWLYGAAGARVASCVGGMEMRRELQALDHGAHIVVGTPGRLVDHLERGSLDLSKLRGLVLDEADEMLDMGFRDEIERILQDAAVERRTLLFSATMPKEIEQLANKYQRDAQRIIATPATEAHRDITYRAHMVAAREKEHAVVNVLREAEANGSIVFVSTRESVNHLHSSLVERGFQAVALSGELTQPERTRALKALRDGRARVLVATDVAARGLDLPDVGLVIHGDIPNDAQVLQHRSGRTGRAGRKGVAVMLVTNTQRRYADRLIQTAKIKPEWKPLPTAEDIRKLDEGRMVADAAALASEVTDDDRQAARRLVEEKPAEELVAMLASILRGRRPVPEEVPLTLGMKDQKPGGPRPTGARGAMATRDFSGPRDFGGPREDAAPRPTSPRRAAPAEAGPASAGGNWFSINVGRTQNADPRWLLPIICRRGNVTKSDIGAIRILGDETRIEIAPGAAKRFAEAVRVPDRKDPNIRFVPSSAPAPGLRTAGARPPTRPSRAPPADGPRPRPKRPAPPRE